MKRFSSAHWSKVTRLPGMPWAGIHERAYAFPFDAVVLACQAAAPAQALPGALSEESVVLVRSKRSWFSITQVTVSTRADRAVIIAVRSDARLPLLGDLAVRRFWTRMHAALPNPLPSKRSSVISAGAS
jgi:hypothetical protein